MFIFQLNFTRIQTRDFKFFWQVKVRGQQCGRKSRYMEVKNFRAIIVLQKYTTIFVKYVIDRG